MIALQPRCPTRQFAGNQFGVHPDLYRETGLGKIIGTPTMDGFGAGGGLRFFLDGGAALVGRVGYYTPGGTRIIDGRGASPYIEVIDGPALMVNGGDPRLDAIR